MVAFSICRHVTPRNLTLSLLRAPTIRIEQKDHNYVLRAKGSGEKLDPERHHTRVDVKAVTLHRFSLKKTDDVWEAFVVLDI